MSAMNRRRLLDQINTEYRMTSASLTSLGRELAEVIQSILDHRQAQEATQEAARVAQEVAHSQIASIVSRCLQSVFNEPYEFRIVLEKKRGKTEARFVFMLNEEEVDPLRSSAGGEVDVASFALRLAALVLHKPALRKVLILDEPFKWLQDSQKAFRGAMVQLLKDLTNELGVQIVMVTHDPEFAVGNVIRLTSPESPRTHPS